MGAKGWGICHMGERWLHATCLLMHASESRAGGGLKSMSSGSSPVVAGGGWIMWLHND